MHTIIIASYGELNSLKKAVESILEQVKPENIGSEKFRIIISDPFSETEIFIKKNFKNRVEFFLDPGEGKSYALNLLIDQYYSENKDELIFITDGDVFLEDDAIKNMLSLFKDRKIGIATGQPKALNSKKGLLGYAAHFFFAEMNRNRRKLAKQKKFLETSGYFVAFRNGVIAEIPEQTCEDAVLPILFWNKGYKIGYAENAGVEVLAPQTLKDYLTQKKRNIKGHMNLHLLEVAKNFSHGTTFFAEAWRGITFFITYPENLREILYTPILFLLRLYAWAFAVYEVKVKKQKYKDGWRDEETPSTSPLD